MGSEMCIRDRDSWKPGAFEMSDFKSTIDDCLANDDRQSSINRGIDNRQSPNSHPIKESSIAELKSALRRFRFPIPTRVVVSEGRPVRVQTDRQGFSSGAIAQAAGPWRTSGNWWSPPSQPEAATARPRHSAERAAAGAAPEEAGELRRDHRAEAAFGREGGWDRDEWDVAMHDGTVYRLVVEREVGQWFLEGVID